MPYNERRGTKFNFVSPNINLILRKTHTKLHKHLKETKVYSKGVHIFSGYVIYYWYKAVEISR
jgi:hypothetical protein